VELKSKVGAVRAAGGSVSGDVFEALIALGYNSREVREALKNGREFVEPAATKRSAEGIRKTLAYWFHPGIFCADDYPWVAKNIRGGHVF